MTLSMKKSKTPLPNTKRTAQVLNKRLLFIIANSHRPTRLNLMAEWSHVKAEWCELAIMLLAVVWMHASRVSSFISQIN